LRHASNFLGKYFAMKRSALRTYEFGPFQVVPEERLLLQDGNPLHLETRAFDTLLVLIRSANHLVKKSELMRAVWADSFVEEGNVTLAISMIRKALGDDGNEHLYIQTVAKHGYRFVCGVREVVKPEPEIPTKFLEIRTLAVLPFGSINTATHEYLRFGLADAIITKLARIGQIIVRPTSAVLKYANAPVDVLSVGREQGVDAILTGHIDDFPDRVRVTAQLVRVVDESILWADSLDESPQCIIALEDEMVKRIANWMSIHISGETKVRPPRTDTESPQAHQFYLEGRYFWNKRTEEGLRRGIECFQKATTADVQYALAYAGLADSYVWLGTYGVGPTFQAYPVAKAAALKALQLDDSLAEPHASLGIVYFYYEWDWSKAEHEFQRAITLNPNYALAHSWYALNLGAMGRYEQALSQVRQAQALDPLSLQINTVAGRILYFFRQYDRSIDAYRKVIDLEPRYARAHTRLGITYAAAGAFEDAIHEFEESQRLSCLDPYLAGHVGHAQARSGNTRKARKLIEELTQNSRGGYVHASSVALIWIGLGKLDQALEWIAKAYQTRCSDMVYAKTEPLLDPLRSDPRFAALLQLNRQ
jgi:DNA-binding winged helix-turn-helix (wHTH) protein/Flp pilus assembly protein TadD